MGSADNPLSFSESHLVRTACGRARRSRDRQSAPPTNFGEAVRRRHTSLRPLGSPPLQPHNRRTVTYLFQRLGDSPRDSSRVSRRRGFGGLIRSVLSCAGVTAGCIHYGGVLKKSMALRTSGEPMRSFTSQRTATPGSVFARYGPFALGVARLPRAGAALISTLPLFSIPFVVNNPGRGVRQAQSDVRMPSAGGIISCPTPTHARTSYGPRWADAGAASGLRHTISARGFLDIPKTAGCLRRQVWDLPLRTRPRPRGDSSRIPGPNGHADHEHALGMRSASASRESSVWRWKRLSVRVFFFFFFALIFMGRPDALSCRFGPTQIRLSADGFCMCSAAARGVPALVDLFVLRSCAVQRPKWPVLLV